MSGGGNQHVATRVYRTDMVKWNDRLSGWRLVGCRNPEGPAGRRNLSADFRQYESSRQGSGLNAALTPSGYSENFPFAATTLHRKFYDKGSDPLSF